MQDSKARPDVEGFRAGLLKMGLDVRAHARSCMTSFGDKA